MVPLQFVLEFVAAHLFETMAQEISIPWLRLDFRYGGFVDTNHLLVAVGQVRKRYRLGDIKPAQFTMLVRFSYLDRR